MVDPVPFRPPVLAGVPPPPVTVACVIAHVIAVCSCEAHIVMAISIGGAALCPKCMQQWYVRTLTCEVEKGEDGQSGKVHLNCVVEPVNIVTLAAH